MMATPASVRVLIVDDQAPFRSAARLVVDLTDGFEVVGEAASAEEALEGLDDWAPDLVLMDIQMPGIDGIAATREVVTLRPGCRVLVLSTYEADDYERGAVDAGAIGFVPKAEFAPDVLVSRWASATSDEAS
jgi:DNA-binding NarL/FixJ family response regulator